MIITIEGKQNEGKSLLAKNIIGDRKAVHIDPKSLIHWNYLEEVDNTTEVIVFDDLPDNYFNDLRVLFSSTEITIERQGRSSVVINTPDVILIKKYY